MPAATSLATLAQSLLTEPTPAQEVRTLLGSTTAASTSAANTAAPVDRFVPSSQSATGNATAEAAGPVHCFAIQPFAIHLTTIHFVHLGRRRLTDAINLRSPERRTGNPGTDDRQYGSGTWKRYHGTAVAVLK